MCHAFSRLVDKTVAITDADRAVVEHRRAQIRVALAGKPSQLLVPAT
jgi:hypothetical protein